MVGNISYLKKQAIQKLKKNKKKKQKKNNNEK